MSDRDGANDIPIVRFHNENRTHIDRIYEQIGLKLQAEFEVAEASMSLEDLRNLAQRQLEAGG